MTRNNSASISADDQTRECFSFCDKLSLGLWFFIMKIFIHIKQALIFSGKCETEFPEFSESISKLSIDLNF